MTPFAGLKELADAAAWAIAARVNWPGLALGDSVISRAVDDRLGAHEGKAPPSTLSDRYSWVRRSCLNIQQRRRSADSGYAAILI